MNTHVTRSQYTAVDAGLTGSNTTLFLGVLVCPVIVWSSPVILLSCYRHQQPYEVKSCLVSWLSLTQVQNSLLFTETSYALPLTFQCFRYVTPCDLSHMCQRIMWLCYFHLHDRRLPPRNKWPETSVRNYHYTLRNSPGECSYLL